MLQKRLLLNGLYSLCFSFTLIACSGEGPETPKVSLTAKVALPGSSSTSDGGSQKSNSLLCSSTDRLCAPSSFEWNVNTKDEFGKVGRLSNYKFRFDLYDEDLDRKFKFFVVKDGEEIENTNQHIEGKAFFVEWAPSSKDVGTSSLQIVARDMTLCNNALKEGKIKSVDTCNGIELIEEEELEGVDYFVELALNIEAHSSQSPVYAGDIKDRLQCKRERVTVNTAANNAKIEALREFGDLLSRPSDKDDEEEKEPKQPEKSIYSGFPISEGLASAGSSYTSGRYLDKYAAEQNEAEKKKKEDSDDKDEDDKKESKTGELFGIAGKFIGALIVGGKKVTKLTLGDCLAAE